MNQRSSSSSFKIGTDDEGPDPYGRPDRPGRPRPEADARIAKLSRRLTIVSIVMPLLLILAAGLGYLFLEKGRETEKEAFQALVESVASLEAANQGIDERLGGMSRQMAELKQSMDDKEAPMNEAFMVFEKTSASLRKDLRQVNQRLKKIDEALTETTAALARIDAAKADASQVAAVEQALETLRTTQLGAMDERITSLGASVTIIQEDVRQSMAEFGEAFAKDQDAAAQAAESVKAELAGLSADYQQLKKDLVDVLSVTIDQKGLNRAIQNQEKRYRSEIQALKRSLEAKDRSISRLQTEIQSLDRRITQLGRNRSPLGTPKPGSFIEQNIE